MRVFFVILVFFLVTSCDKLPFTKSQNLPELDTIVDFTSVDLSPSFKVCDSIVAKQKKSECFRKTIHKKIGQELLQHRLISKDSINEIVSLELFITAEGKVTLAQLNSSEPLKEMLPQLDSLLQIAIAKLPQIYPAIKRGIPVATKYTMPIQIVVED